jgi:glycosyltransferase involved in cell wall biosynthesis
VRIVWDVSPLAVPPTGIGRYIRGMLVACAQGAPGDEWVALSVGGAGETGRLAAHLDGLDGVVRVHRRLRPGRVFRRALNASPVAALELLTGRCDVFVGSEWLHPRQRHGARAAIVYDLVPLTHPHLTTAKTRALHLRKLADVRRCDVVVCISEATARAVTEHLGIARERLVVARPGVDDAFRLARPGRSPSGGRPYVLSVGTLEPRKNLGAVIDAFALLRPRHPSLALVLAGGAGWCDDGIDGRIAAHGLAGSVVRLGYVADADLPGVVAGAAAFCLPALVEGFGMPVAEALAAGVPVVCSDHESLDEAAGDAALRAAPTDAEAIAAALEVALRGDATRIAAGRDHAATLTWSADAATIVAAIKAIAVD